jgi:phosphotransferase system enzyme I (PtsI)
MRAEIAGWHTAARTASIGFAMGPSRESMRLRAGGRAVGTPSDEELALRAALASAGRQIAALGKCRGRRGCADPRISSCFAGGRGLPRTDLCGNCARNAGGCGLVVGALDEQIADYNSAPDEYLQARSSDLADLRDRVLRTLRGGRSEALKIPGGAVSAPTICHRRNSWKSTGRAAEVLRSFAAARRATSRCWPEPAAFPWSCNSGGVDRRRERASGRRRRDARTRSDVRSKLACSKGGGSCTAKNRASARAILAATGGVVEGREDTALINIQRVEDLNHSDAQYADGIGLMRTEFLLG